MKYPEKRPADRKGKDKNKDIDKDAGNAVLLHDSMEQAYCAKEMAYFSRMRWKKNVKCFNCGKKGHFAKECKEAGEDGESSEDSAKKPAKRAFNRPRKAPSKGKAKAKAKSRRITDTINGSPISWRSQRQRSTAKSTTEAEYIAASKAACELVWLKDMLQDADLLEGKSKICTRLQVDNKG
ncbi:hypothetical protein PABG_11132 [Paracoccidioides brasiliensis Pb03]|nr:hypothetical protein PABG_11132 [Paracoccidioides brasiliensis Pb03]